MSKDFLKAVEDRRTFYFIGKDVSLSDDELLKIIRHAVLHAPSAFNSQSARVLVLLGGEHDKLWDITTEILRGIVPAANFASTGEKLASFRSGYGTVLYFEDQDTVAGLQKSFPLYKDNFPLWSLQSSGMLQFVVWTALETEGLGASLQHYNPLIDEKVRETWNIPQSWKLLGEMPFGKPTGAPGEKDFLPVEDRLRVAKS